MGEVVALDIGGTKLAAAIVTTAGELREQRRELTPASSDPEVVWGAVCSLLDPIVDADTQAIGVGCGGPMTSGGATVSPLNIAGWRSFPLLERLERRYQRAVGIDNDAKALATGEGRWGAAKGLTHFVALVVSTGVGGGVVLDGRLLDGIDGNAGHLGHMIVVPDGRQCACGARGCLEAEASGTAIAQMTGAPASEAPQEIRERCGRLVGRACGSAAALLGVSRFFVSGSVALGFGAAFFDAAQRELTQCAGLDFLADARIEPCALGADGPLLGAGAVGFSLLESGGSSASLRNRK